MDEDWEEGKGKWSFKGDRDPVLQDEKLLARDLLHSNAKILDQTLKSAYSGQFYASCTSPRLTNNNTKPNQTKIRQDKPVVKHLPGRQSFVNWSLGLPVDTATRG